MSLFLPSRDVSDAPQPGHIGAHEGVSETEGILGTGSVMDRCLRGIEFGLQLGIKLGNQLDDFAKKQVELNERIQRFTPIDYECAASGQAVAGTPLLLVLGTPDEGTYWEVEQAAIGGLDVNVAAAGTAGLYVAGAIPQLFGTNLTGHGGLTNVADSNFAALPKTNFYGRRDVIVNSSEYLYAVVFGGTAAQFYVAEASVSVFNIVAAQGRDTVTL